MKSRLFLIGTVSLLALFFSGCRGIIPEPLREPAQEAVEKAVKTPGIDLHVNIGGLSSSGLNVGVEARINNPNLVSLDIGNLQVVARGETGQTYIQDTMPGGSIAPNSGRTFTHSIVIPLDVLSERSMVVTVDTRGGVAGITLPVSATITVNIPDLQKLISAPSIALSVNIGSLSSNGLRTDLQANISNPNPLSLDIGNLQVVVKGQAGNVIATSTMMGGTIAPNSTGAFGSDITIPLQVLNERSITVTADTKAGVAGITLPISATVTVNMPDVQSLIRVPSIALSVNIGQLSSNGLNTSFQANISNPNPLSLDIGDLQAVVRGQSGNVITTATMMGHSIAPNSSGTLTGNIVIPLQVLNERSITVTIDTRAGVAGITLPLSATGTFQIPGLSALISAPQISVNVEPKWKATFPLPSLELLITAKVMNNNSIGLVIGDLRVSLYKSDGSLVKSASMVGGTMYPMSTTTFSNSIILGSELLSLIGSNATVKINTEVGITGVSERIPISAEITFPVKLPGLP
jgi:LEA14-like dessication related protein